MIYDFDRDNFVKINEKNKEINDGSEPTKVDIYSDKIVPGYAQTPNVYTMGSDKSSLVKPAIEPDDTISNANKKLFDA